MSNVERFLSEVSTLFDSNVAVSDLKLHTHQRLLSFIGRAALRDDGYAPREEIFSTLNDARTVLHKLQVRTNAASVRLELLSELDRVIEQVKPQRFPAPKL